MHTQETSHGGHQASLEPQSTLQHKGEGHRGVRRVNKNREQEIIFYRVR